MTSEITGFSGGTKKDPILSITALDAEEFYSESMARYREDEPKRELRYEFNLNDPKERAYACNYLKRQKVVKEAKPRFLHEAAAATVGTLVQAPNWKYRVAEFY